MDNRNQAALLPLLEDEPEFEDVEPEDPFDPVVEPDPDSDFDPDSEDDVDSDPDCDDADSDEESFGPPDPERLSVR